MMKQFIRIRKIGIHAVNNKTIIEVTRIYLYLFNNDYICYILMYRTQLLLVYL